MAFIMTKDLENKLHERLYKNVYLLTWDYPASKELKSVLSKNMFKKSNKDAFQHVTHFLLTIVDKKLFNQKIPWPILDRKMEIQYRNEVMKFINDMNSRYEDTRIPALMTSHLLTPGGLKFTEFMFHLSQFVLLEHIKRNIVKDESELLLPIVPSCSKNIALMQLQNLNNLIDHRKKVISDKRAAFDLKYKKARDLALKIIEEKPKIEKNIVVLKKEMHEFFEKFDTLDCKTELSITERLNSLNSQIETVKLAASIFEECNNHVSLLKQIITPRNYAHIFDLPLAHSSTSESVKNPDLFKHFDKFLELLQANISLVKVDNDNNLKEQLIAIQKIRAELILDREQIDKLLSDIHNFVSTLEDINSKLTYKNDNINEALSQRAQKIFEPTPDLLFNVKPNCRKDS